MFAARKTASASAVDPNFENVVLLLNDTGTNGQQNNTFLDSSANNFTVTRNGTPTQGSVTPYWPDGQWSVYFDGAADFLSLAANAAFSLTADFTLETWIWLDSTVVSSRPDNLKTVNILGGLGSTSGVCSFEIGGSTTTAGIGLTIYQDSPLVNLTVSVTVPLDQWVHIAYVRTGSTIYGFVNGTRYTLGTSSSTLIRSTGGIQIGQVPATTYDSDFKGYMSNFRLLKGTALYTSNFTPSISPLTAITNTSLLTCQSNRFRDNSSNNFAVTPNGTPQVFPFEPFSPPESYTTSLYGGSGLFSGTSQYVTAASNTAFAFGTGDFTMEAWIYPTSTANANIISTGESSGQVTMYLDTMRLAFVIQFVGALVGTTTIRRNAWTHVAVTRTGTTVRLFVNGIQDGTSTRSNSLGQAGIGVAGHPTGAGTMFAGYISDARLVKGTSLYTATFTPPSTPLTAVTNTSLLLNTTNAGVYDAVTLNNITTVGNAQVSTAQSKWGSSSVYFDGTGDYLLTSNIPTLTLGSGNWTIEFWVRFDSTGRTENIYDQRTGTAAGVYPTIARNTSNQIVFFVNGANRIVGTTSTAANTWYHVAVVKSGTTTRLYVNGTAEGSTYTDTNNYLSNPVYIGSNASGSGGLAGYVDDLRVTFGVARYTANFTPPSTPFPTR